MNRQRPVLIDCSCIKIQFYTQNITIQVNRLKRKGPWLEDFYGKNMRDHSLCDREASRIKSLISFDMNDVEDIESQSPLQPSVYLPE